MAFLVNKNFSLILYPKNFPHKNGQINNLKGDCSQWRILAIINENSIGNISLKSVGAGKKCICGKNITHYCIIGNKINGDLLFIGFDCLKKIFTDFPLIQEYKSYKKLIRKCKNCDHKFLITEMVGGCCEQCKEYRTSNYFGCVSCLSYERGMAGSQQCINCQIGKRPYYQIKTFSGDWQNVLEEEKELIYNGIGFDLVTNYDLNKELKSLIHIDEKCIQCNESINLQEQLRTVPIDQLNKCINCVYPNHGRCVECNKFMPEKIGGKDKCTTCFKKFMRTCPKRKCETCDCMEIPNVPSNIDKTQCYSCWRKTKK